MGSCKCSKGSEAFYAKEGKCQQFLDVNALKRALCCTKAENNSLVVFLHAQRYYFFSLSFTLSLVYSLVYSLSSIFMRSILVVSLRAGTYGSAFLQKLKVPRDHFSDVLSVQNHI